jgi:hypothetical protein
MIPASWIGHEIVTSGRRTEVVHESLRNGFTRLS